MINRTWTCEEIFSRPCITRMFWIDIIWSSLTFNLAHWYNFPLCFSPKSSYVSLKSSLGGKSSSVPLKSLLGGNSYAPLLVPLSSPKSSLVPSKSPLGGNSNLVP